MALFLVQHGIALPKDQDPDPDLSGEGIAHVERIAGVARGYGVRVSRILHSGKKRARRTAELFAAALNPEKGVEETAGLNPLDDVTAFAQHVDSLENVMLVGHQPFMGRLTSYLLTGSPDKTLFKFQNGGIVCLDQEPGEISWLIKWSLSPKID
jgi:phosphohistidine phosphatase